MAKQSISQPPPSVTQFDDEGGMAGMIERFAVDWEAVRSYYRITCSQGDGERLLGFLGETMESLDGVDFEGLDVEGRIDWVLFRNYLQMSMARERQNQLRLSEVEGYLPFAGRIAGMMEARRRAWRPKGREVAALLDGVVASIAEVAEALEERGQGGGGEFSVKDKVLALRACKLIDRLRSDLGDWGVFHRGYDPEVSWWVARPLEEVECALEEYGRSLRRWVLGVEDGGDEPVVGDPIGGDALLDDLAGEWIAYSPEELIAIAEKEWDWCKVERVKAAREMGFGDDWRAALAHANEDYLEPGEQPGLIRELALEAIDYLKENDLVTIPDLCEETWEMKMMTPERQKVNPYFTGGQTISVSYPTQGMSQEDKLMSLRGNNRHFARATVQHELIPGHHLQLYMAKRYRTYREIFKTPFYVEGWALYWEIMLWEKGFHHSPEGRTGALFWRAHRAARVIFSLRFHLGQMTADEAIAFLVEEVGHEHRNAVAEVRRSVSDDYPPLYQAAYLLGGLQMRAMRKELVDEGDMAEKDFHDAVLKQNYLPIELLRAALRGEMLEKNRRSGWRFFDEKAK